MPIVARGVGIEGEAGRGEVGEVGRGEVGEVRGRGEVGRGEVGEVGGNTASATFGFPSSFSSESGEVSFVGEVSS